MLKKIAAEYHFRNGRRSRDIAQLRRAARLDSYNSRAAIELGRLGVADPICASLFMSLCGLREFAMKEGLSADASQLLRMIVDNLSLSRGQYFQDIVALWASGQKRDGFFVEVGTGNGELLSNTFMLEKDFGWNGVLFEPDRRFHSSISEKRSAILDKRAAYFEDCDAREFVEVTKAGELSTLADHTRVDGRHRFGNVNTIQTITLNTALAEHDAPTTIDFMSIDTEGSELEVLKGIDLNYYDVRFLAIEHNFAEGKKEQLADFLAPYNYQEVFPEFSHHDIWLMKPC